MLFKNHDIRAIKHLLKEIGKYRYDRALEQMKIQQLPLSMKGFYLEANTKCIFLCYRYPSRIKIKIMKVDGFAGIPKEDWQFKKEGRNS